ncbi:MAG TPA: hypothetical protein VF540_13510 [Segetibacter sp.]|jgi:hypothetical protein
MSKFGAIIEQAKNQNTGKPENQKKSNTENKKTIKQENQITRKPEKIISKKLDEKEVNLSIKVGESRRRHWVSEAKRQGTSLTAVILESLSNRFGEPE